MSSPGGSERRSCRCRVVLALFFPPYIPGMTSAPFWPESFGSGPRSAGVTGAEGSLDAGLAETILAGSGMERFLNSGFMRTRRLWALRALPI
jgi:hypothetical protein